VHNWSCLFEGTINGGGSEARTGAGVLAILANPINVTILRELAAGPKSPSDIAGESGDERVFDLTPGGWEQIAVADVLENWLERAPDGPISFGSIEWERATEALAAGWSTTTVHNLAAGPRSLADLDSDIDALNYPILERHVEAMCNVGQVEARSEGDRETTYAVTDWLREGIGPLAAASRCERRHLPDESPPIAGLDVEAAFQLALPLLALPAGLSGSCRLSVELPENGELRPAGAIAHVEDERIASSTPDLEGDVDAWANGDAEAWFSAVIDSEADRVEVGGEGQLARAIVEDLHEALFGDKG
jgi:DNA-binding HxlR family transcriptional regulator